MPLSHSPILRAEGLDFKDGYRSSLPLARRAAKDIENSLVTLNSGFYKRAGR